jgi:acyl-CoA dehydrogenase
MDSPTLESSAFRLQVREFLNANYPGELLSRPDELFQPLWGGRRQLSAQGPERDWLTAMGTAGWIVPAWPKKYGGGGLTRPEVAVLNDEMRGFGARPALRSPNLGILMLGPVLLESGTEDQKARFLPPIARGEIRWCQGFSEPSAGSDLASLRTRAEMRDDGCYHVTGHKIWSSFAHEADWMFCLVRTDSGAEKHQGLSLLLIDLASSGIRVSPIRLISGESLFNEVLLHDVIVPVEQRLGAEGDGWPLAMSILQHERSSVFATGPSSKSRSQNSLTERLSRRGNTDHYDIERQASYAQIAAHLAVVRGVKATQRRYRDEGRRDLASASLIKLITSESHQQRYDLLVDIAGLDALVWDGEGVDSSQAIAHAWLRSRGNSIEGGTSEMQINMIAKRTLGLVDSN